MTLAFQPPVRRVNRGKGHGYADANGRKVPGVTTLIGDGVPKPALINWAADTTAAYAVDHWDELAQLPPSVRYKKLQSARWAEKDRAANRGTQVHALAERLVRDEEIDVPDELAGYVESYVRFLDEFDVRPVLIEAVVVSHKHGYAGTLDLIAELVDRDDPEPDPDLKRRETWLLDIKTNRSGIFGETALQLAGYRYADCWVEDDEIERPMPPVDRVGAVHVRADGYDLVPVEAGPLQHRDLLYAREIGRFVGESRGLVGAPIVPPTTSTFRLVRDDNHVDAEAVL
jgi:hypothetical protein